MVRDRQERTEPPLAFPDSPDRQAAAGAEVSLDERDLDQPYERVAERAAAFPERTATRGWICTEGRHRKYTPAVVVFRIGLVDGARVLTTGIVGACAKHRRDLQRTLEHRRTRFARSTITPFAEPLA